MENKEHKDKNNAHKEHFNKNHHHKEHSAKAPDHHKEAPANANGDSSETLDKNVEIVGISFREAGKTVLLVEQNAKKAMTISDRVYVLETGSISAEGNAADLINDERIKKAYLGE